jgi:hypothetical protein
MRDGHARDPQFSRLGVHLDVGDGRDQGAAALRVRNAPARNNVAAARAARTGFAGFQPALSAAA